MCKPIDKNQIAGQSFLPNKGVIFIYINQYIQSLVTLFIVCSIGGQLKLRFGWRG